VFLLRKNLNEVMPSNNKKKGKKKEALPLLWWIRSGVFVFTRMKEILQIRVARGLNINLCLNKPANREIKNKRLKCNLNWVRMSIYLPTANTLPKVNNNANLMGLANTIKDYNTNRFCKAISNFKMPTCFHWNTAFKMSK